MASEILSIQCGHFSNLIGAHWWNIQQAEARADEIRHACMFREEVNAATGSRRYTPRLLLIDSSGQSDGDGSDGDATPAWDGQVEKHLQQPDKGAKKCKLDSEADVGAWSSVLRVPLSSRSRLIVPENSTSAAVDSYEFGLQAWEEKMFQTEVEDTLRYFAEECDSIQGFHLLTDWGTGFGALGTCIAGLIADEYASKPVVSFPVLASDCIKGFTAINACLTLNAMVADTSLVCPLSLDTAAVHPWYSIAGENPHIQSYEASVVMAAGTLDTITLFYRSMASSSCAALCAGVATYGRKLAVLSASLPFPVLPKTPLSSTLQKYGGLHALLRPLTPFFPHGEEDVLWNEALALRGVASNHPLWPSSDQRSTFHSSMVDLLAEQLCAGPQSQHHYQWSTSVVGLPLPLYPPSTEPAPPVNVCTPQQRLLQVPVCASLQSRSGAGLVVAHLMDQITHFKAQTVPLFRASHHLEEDAFMEMSHSLCALHECYGTSSCPED